MYSMHVGGGHQLHAVCAQGYVLDGWPDRVSAATALERALTGLSLDHEAALHMRAPKMAPPPPGRLPDLARALSLGAVPAMRLPRPAIAFCPPCGGQCIHAV